MTTHAVERWWAALTTHLDTLAGYLHAEGYTTDDARHHHTLNHPLRHHTWPLLARQMIHDGQPWPHICHTLALGHAPATDIRLADLDHHDREALMAEARQQIKHELGLG